MSERFSIGIGEWYGRSFAGLTNFERQQLLGQQTSGPRPQCLHLDAGGNPIRCSKPGGVCSLRGYIQDTTTNEVHIAPGEKGRLITLCPNRFNENGTIHRWVGEILLGDQETHLVKEVKFLKPVRGQVDVEEEKDNDDKKFVGRIDGVLVSKNRLDFSWCAFETQAVYFSGDEMGKEWPAIRSSQDDTIVFPAGNRHPDFRSSGPKRLLPQLQVKVPTLRRWGKKMAVVVDEAFFASLAPMKQVSDVSNCDIAWFVVRYEFNDQKAILRPGAVVLTTLEHAVDGLVAGEPISQAMFEERIRTQLAGPTRKRRTI